MNKFYMDYSEFLEQIWPGIKVQKLSVDAGHNCPNRDGTLGRGGCIYCNNSAFSPDYCHRAGSVREQIQEGKRFFARKYPQMRYLAYFQAYTSTHAPLRELIAAYDEALEDPEVVGLVIGTRPDCMPDELLEYLRKINAGRCPVIVEYGAETMHDRTLRLIKRHHDAECVRQAVLRTAAAGIRVGLHLIMGLPGETREDMLESVRQVCALPVSTLKFHQLQIVRDTPLANLYLSQQQDGSRQFPDIRLFTAEEYLELCVELTQLVPPHIAIERFTASCPPALLIAPAWGLKNYQFTHRLHALLFARCPIPT